MSPSGDLGDQAESIRRWPGGGLGYRSPQEALLPVFLGPPGLWCQQCPGCWMKGRVSKLRWGTGGAGRVTGPCRHTCSFLAVCLESGVFCSCGGPWPGAIISQCQVCPPGSSLVWLLCQAVGAVRALTDFQGLGDGRGGRGAGGEEQGAQHSPAPLQDGGSAMSLSQTKDSTLLVLLIIINLIKRQLQLRTQ